MTRKPRSKRGAGWKTTAAVFLLALTAAWAQETPPGEVSPAPAQQGSPLLLESTDVRTVITGPVAHVVVTQRWSNPNTFPVDGLYIFPLPDNAAVNDMTLRIGERVIRSDMKRRDEARAEYERARREGRVAGLLDQERPNVFVQQVANLMPGMKVDVTLAFDHEITCEDGNCEYVFPTVVGPRFVPASQADPGRIDPPVVSEGSGTGQTLTLHVDLDAGVPIRSLQSVSHRITMTREDDTHVRVALARERGAVLNKDFRLRWSVGGDAPELGLLAWRDPARSGEPGVFTLIVQPPSEVSDADATPREMIFVLDCSGSMSGIPIEAAKNVVRKALRAVRPRDTFQIIRFSDRASGLGPEPLSPTPENIRKALAYLDSLHGQGGTQMISGIRAALDAPADQERLRIVAFLTDGYIGNESEILGAVRRRIGAARLFSFGIGSSVNRYLLEGLAEEGRGAAAFIENKESPDQMVDRFIKRIETPVLTDIHLTWEDVQVEDLEPARIPDLFAGQTLLVHGRYTKPGTGLVTLEGRSAGRPVILSRAVTFADAEDDHEALGRLWARARIHRLERELHDGPRADVREAITDLGLRFRLMTPWTSLVAVDSLVSNDTGASRELTVPVEMPEGVPYEGVFGGRGTMVQARFANRPASPPPAIPFAGSAARKSFGSPWQEAPGRPGTRVTAQKPAPRSVETPALGFTRITLYRADGSRLVVQEDGEIWRLEGRGRTLVHTLSAAEMDRMRVALAHAGARAWGAAAARGVRIEVIGAWGNASLPLPSTDAAVVSLVRLIEGFV